LSAGAYVYVAGGSGDERTMRENIEAFARWRFIPRVLVDTSARDLSTTVLGRRVTMPIGIAPFALQGLIGTLAGPADPGTAFVSFYHDLGEAAGAPAERQGLRLR
jgi:isopentenyl diphosphate isomerase/L-lactate dehydrogenase-like FMN-dependent dehydrogenase